MPSKASSTKTIVKGGGTSSSYSGTMVCNICRGTGRVPKSNRFGKQVMKKK